MRNLIVLLFLMFAFNSCSSKFYSKEDYSFYDAGFKLEDGALLKTNGIYLLDSVWSKSMAEVSSKKNIGKVCYIFYKTGQSNMIISDEKEFDYKQFVLSDFNRYKNDKKLGTLFQGYYKLNRDKIVIEKVNTALRRFNYSYGYLENEKLIIVKPNSLQGEGNFEDKYFLDTYKEIYTFIPVEDLDAILPYW